MDRAPLQRSLRILKIVAEAGGPVGFQRVAEAAELNITTARRLLLALAEEGVLTHDSRSKRFTIGPDFIRICAVVVARQPELSCVQPALRELAASTGETACLYLLDRSDWTSSLVAVERSPQPLGYALAVGAKGHLHAGSGKAMLAFLAPEEIRTVVLRGLPAVTDRTPTEPAALQAALDLVRARGFSVSHGEQVEGAVGVAAPVTDADRRVTGALVLTMPGFRAADRDLELLGQAVSEAASRMSGRTDDKAATAGRESGR